MEARDTFKKVVHFANWEYKEKRPKSVRVLRLKSKSTISLGVLPEFQMRTIGPVIYLVVSDQGDELMIYFFNRNGERTGGQHYEPTPKFMKKLNKSTIVKYQLPKKERKELVDSTYMLQQEFSKIHQSISNKLGITHKYRCTVLVDKNLQFNLTRMLGSKRIKKEFHVPPQIKEKNFLELVATIEWFYSYLTSSIPKPEEIPDLSILYDLAILLSVVLNQKLLDKISALALPPQTITIHNTTFDFTKGVRSAISALSETKSQKDLIILLKKYCVLLNILNRYGMSLSLLELVHIVIFSCEMFNTETDFHALYTSEKEEIVTYFYFRLFSRVHELAKEFNLESLKNKAYFLSMLFGLHHLTPEEIMEIPYTLAEVIENIGIMIKDPYIYEPIKRIDAFVSNIISEYILRYLECKTQYAVETDTLDLMLEIQNHSNYVLQNFEYELIWKPKKKVQLVREEKSIRAQDLHEKVKKNYLFTISNKGSITFSCKISFTNPVYQDKIIRKTIRLQKIIMEP